MRPMRPMGLMGLVGRAFAAFALFAAGLALVGCSDKPTGSGGSGALGASEALQHSASLEALLLDEPPAGAVSVTAARAAAVPGEPVVVSGFVGGRAEPFVGGRAAFVLADPEKLTACSGPDDECETPWDCCCDPPELIAASVASVQVVDGEGAVVREGIRGLGGMTELSRLVVAGTVAEGSGPGGLVVNATGIYVELEQAGERR